MTIRQKLLYFVLALAILPSVLISLLIGYNSISASRDSLEAKAEQQLIAVRDARKDAIEAYFSALEDELLVTSKSLMTIDALSGFNQAVSELDSTESNLAFSSDKLRNFYQQDYTEEFNKNSLDAISNASSLLSSISNSGQYLQSKYIAENINPIGSKDALDSVDDNTLYSALHSKYHPVFRDFIKQTGVYDLLLIDAKTGTVIYSVDKEVDFGTSLLNGPFKDSGLAQVFSKANQLNSSRVVFEDYKPYGPAYNAQSSFIASPVFDSSGAKIGILAFQLPISQVNAIMTVERKWKDKGLGLSGETYLLGADKRLRSEARTLLEDKAAYLQALQNANVNPDTLSMISRSDSSIGLQEVDSIGAQKALSGETGFETFKDYRNVEVLSAFTSVNIFGASWALLSEIDTEEAFADATSLTNTILMVAVAVGLLLAAVALFFGLRFVKTLSNPIADLDDTVRKITEGDLEARVDVKTQDELGELGSALNALMDEKVSALAEAEEENERLNNSIINLIRALNDISEKDFSVTVPVSEDIIGTVAASLNTLTDETSDILKEVTNVSNGVLEVSGNVKEVSDHVIEVSSQEREEILRTLEALDLSSKEMDGIAEEAKSANVLAQETIDNAKKALESVQDSSRGIESIRETIFETEKRIKRLGERSQEISGIVSLINNIAERTHILALNASMHAASAGEAGRGFAVVANEVQRLAENAKQSTEEISTLANSIRTETVDAVNAMNNVISQVAEGTKLAEQAGLAMERNEQATSNLVGRVKVIADSAEKQAESSNEIKVRASEIEKKSRETEASLNDQKESTDKLSQYSKVLADAVGVFKLPE